MGAKPLTRHAHAAMLAGVLGLALCLRLVGLGYGLPAVYNPDETAIMSRALRFATGDLNPHNFLYPTLYFYVLFAWIGAYGLLAMAAGRVESVAAFERQFFVDPAGIYLAGRLLGVICGVATVAVLYLVADRLFGRRVALAAAAFLAVAPTAVRDAHYVKHDVPTTLLITLALLAMVRIWPIAGPGGWRWREPLVGAALCGAAASMHYYAIFLMLPLASAVWFRLKPAGAAARVRALLAVGLAAGLVFAACSPFILVEWRVAFRDIGANRGIVMDRALDDAGGPLPSAGRYLAMLWQDAAGWPVALLAIGGIAQSARLSRPVALLLMLFPAAFLVFISNTVPASRYLNPVVPFLALFAGLAVIGVASRIRGAHRGALAAILTIVAMLPGLAASVRTGLFFRQTDTRTLAQQYIESHVPPGTTVLVQPYSAPLRPSRASLIEATELHRGDVARASTKVSRQLALEPYPEPSYRLFYLGDGGLDDDKVYVGYGELGGPRGLERLRDLGVQYVVLTRYNHPRAATLPFLEALTREGTQIAVFSPHRPDRETGPPVEPYLHNTDARLDDRLARPGPVLELWRLM